MSLEITQQSGFGYPNVFNPMEQGLLIEDIWPSMYIPAEREAEMRRKIGDLAWAKSAFEVWKREADQVLGENIFFYDEAGEKRVGRTKMFSNAGHHRIFDPSQCERMWNPNTYRFDEGENVAKGSWIQLQHERMRRLMSSMAMLSQLGDNDDYAKWSCKALSEQVKLYATFAETYDQEAKPYSYMYGGLYEAQTQLQFAQTLEWLLAGSRIDDELLGEVKAKIITPACEALLRWMGIMSVFNMSVWGMAALAKCGRLLEREDFLEMAYDKGKSSIKNLLELGLRRNEKTGKPDGFWFEHSPFYGCFYVITPITPLYEQAREAGILNEDHDERYQTFYDAMPNLADAKLRILSISDRVCPGGLNLTQTRHLYEYASGRVSEKYAPLLSHLYQVSGAPRDSFTAVAFGPDDLPAPEQPTSLTKSVVLPEAGLVTFRGEKNDSTLWFANLRDYNPSHQGHHHCDKLSFSLHAKGQVISSDLGWPGLEDPETHKIEYLGGSLSHNTLILDEYDQTAAKDQTFDFDLEAAVPWAKASFRGDSSNKEMNKVFADHHNARIKDDHYEDAVISRSVIFDDPFFIVIDELDAESEKRFGMLFHSRGAMTTRTIPGDGVAPLNLPKLPEGGAWSLFGPRTHADGLQAFIADWRIDSHIFLRMVTQATSTFDAHWGETPDNPEDVKRGSVFLRTPGKQCRFLSLFEIHAGYPQVQNISQSEGGEIELELVDGSRRSYPKLPI